MADVSVKATIEGFSEVDAGLKQTKKNIDSISDSQRDSLQAATKYAEAFRLQNQTVQGASAEIQKILGRYDPLGAKLRQLQTDFAALDKAIASGATGGTSDIALDKTMKALNDEITKTKGLMDIAGGAVTGTGMSMAALGMNTKIAQRELMMLGREALSGNFSHMPMTFARLVQHSNLLALALNPIVLGFLGVTAAAVGLGAVFAIASREMKEMNNALVLTSNFAGMTQEQMSKLSRTIEQNSTLTIGASREIVTQIVASGQYSAENVGKMAALVDSYAKATGKAVDKVTPELIKMFEDPAKASEELNKKYGYLEASELKRIQTLQESGDKQAAVTAALDAFSSHIPKAVENLGSLERGYNAVAKALSDYWQSLKTGALSIGAVPGLDDQLNAVRKTIATLEAHQKFSGSNVGQKELEVQRALLAVLEKQEVARAGVAKLVAEATEERKKQVEADEKINKSTLNRIATLEAERDFIIKNGTASAEKDRRVLELNKEIRDMRLSMASEATTSIKSRIDGELAILDIQTKSVIAQTSAMVKLGTLSQEEANARILVLQLEQNINEQTAVREKLKLSLNRGEREVLQHTLDRLEVEYESLKISGGITKELTAHNKLLQENAMLLQSSTSYLTAMSAIEEKRRDALSQFHTTNTAVTREITFQTSLIGKTKEQQELLTALRKLDLGYETAKKALISDEGVMDEKRLANLNELYTLNRERLVAAVTEHSEASKEINQFWKTAAKDMQRSMSSFFFDIMQGNLTDLAGSFKKSIDQMVANALAAKAALALFGPDFGTAGSSAPIGGLIGKGLAFLGFGGGGFTGVTDADLAMGFAGGGSFTVGGSGGTDSQMVRFKASPGERVTVQTPGQSEGSRIVVNNTFNVSGTMDRRSQAQIAAAAGEGVQRALARNT